MYIDTRHSRQRAVILLLALTLTWTKDSSFSRGPFPFAGPTVDVAVACGDLGVCLPLASHDSP